MSNTNKIRIERLETLYHILKNHKSIFKEKEFDMNQWSCDTAACALGSAASYPPFIKKGLRISLEEDWLGREVAFVIFNGSDGYNAGAEFFKIEHDETRWLFSPNEYINTSGEPYAAGFIKKYVTPDVVAKRVRALIDYYRVRPDGFLNPNYGLRKVA